MLTHHTYFNLDAFKNPATDKIWEHTLHMPCKTLSLNHPNTQKKSCS